MKLKFIYTKTVQHYNFFIIIIGTKNNVNCKPLHMRRLVREEIRVKNLILSTETLSYFLTVPNHNSSEDLLQLSYLVTFHIH